MMTRRKFIALGAVASLAACSRQTNAIVTRDVPVAPQFPPLPAIYGAITDEPHPIPAVPEGVLAPEFWRRDVVNPWPGHPRGTIIVDPDAANLHFIQTPDRAIRYGVSVGAAGFAWAGTARLQFCRTWPRWKVPEAMISRKPELAPYSVSNGGMAPGPGNPMGARALYLFQNGVDTLYRIHGDASPDELGRAVSSGCIRMLDQDVIDLHRRAIHGSAVVVLPSLKPDRLNGVY